LKHLPKVLLHDHLDGGLRAETIIEIADQIGYTKLPTQNSSELADWFQAACDSGSLERYLETFDHHHRGYATSRRYCASCQRDCD